MIGSCVGRKGKFLRNDTFLLSATIFKFSNRVEHRFQRFYPNLMRPHQGGYPITQSRRFFFAFTHSRNERKIWVFTQYRKNWVENGSFHEITQEKFSFHEFTLKFYAFHASRMEGISRIHADIFSFSRIHAGKKSA